MSIKQQLLTGLAATALLLPVGAAQAAPAETTKTEAIVFGFNSCAGPFEFVEMTGTAHTVVKENNDGTFTQRIRIHAKGTSGSGTDYVFNYNVTLVRDFPFITFERDHVMLVSKGSEENQQVKFRYSNESGPDLDVECRG